MEYPVGGVGEEDKHMDYMSQRVTNDPNQRCYHAQSQDSIWAHQGRGSCELFGGNFFDQSRFV